MSKKIITIVLSLMCFCATAQNANDLVGKQFYRKDKKAIVEFKKQGNLYKAQTVWLLNTTDADGKTRVDKKNPDKSLRRRPILGLYVFYDLDYNKSTKTWIGEAYHPQHGLTCSVELRLLKNGNLEVKGTKWGLSKSEQWEKVELKDYKKNTKE